MLSGFQAHDSLAQLIAGDRAVDRHANANGDARPPEFFPTAKRSAASTAERVSIETVDVNGDDGGVGTLQDFFEAPLEGLHFAGMRYRPFGENGDQAAALQLLTGGAQRADG